MLLESEAALETMALPAIKEQIYAVDASLLVLQQRH